MASDDFGNAIPVVRWAADAFQVFAPYTALPKVHVIAAALDGRNQVCAHRIVQIGTERDYEFPVDSILNQAVELGGYAFLVAITHPWMSPMPTPDDLYNARALQRASVKRGVHLLDVLVVTIDQYTSMRREEFV